jgi:DNA invertase Pin-like site-specific DNA recombinase
MKVGYARVSTADQDYSYQLEALEQAGCEMIFKDKASGKRMSRPDFDRMLTYLREGDSVVVWKIDRLGRNFTEMVATMAELFKQGINIVSTSQAIDTNQPMGKAMAYFLSIVAEMEAEFNRERTKQSLEARRQRGIKGGRPRHSVLSDPKKLKIIQDLYNGKQHTVGEIMRMFNLKDKTTLYRYLKTANNSE